MKGQAKYSATVRGKVLVITFNDPAATKLEVDTGTFNARQTERAVLHGVKQVVVDSMAGKNLPDSIKASRRVVDGLKRGGFGMVSLDIEALVGAIMTVTGLDEEAVRARVDTVDEEKLKEWATQPRIAAEMATIEAKRKAAEAANAKDDFKFD